MGRDNSKYKKSLHQQVYDRLTSMQAFGESRDAGKKTGEDKNKIYSYDTYQTYKKHVGYFIDWIKLNHP